MVPSSLVLYEHLRTTPEKTDWLINGMEPETEKCSLLRTAEGQGQKASPVSQHWAQGDAHRDAVMPAHSARLPGAGIPGAYGCGDAQAPLQIQDAPKAVLLARPLLPQHTQVWHMPA